MFYFKVTQNAPKCNAIDFGSLLKLTNNYYFLNSYSLCRVRMKNDVNKSDFMRSESRTQNSP